VSAISNNTKRMRRRTEAMQWAELFLRTWISQMSTASFMDSQSQADSGCLGELSVRIDELVRDPSIEVLVAIRCFSLLLTASVALWRRRFWCETGAGFSSFRSPASDQSPSKRLRNLAQARGTIRIKSPGARRLLDHPIGRNEHGDRIGGWVILGQPGQRAMRSAA
jgi:hypothetical protein